MVAVTFDEQVEQRDQGLAVMVIDPVQIAETAGLHHGVLNQEMYECYTRAYTPAGFEGWNTLSALDYLETCLEVNSEWIAMTGGSGGAAMSWFTAAVEPRIEVVIPICESVPTQSACPKTPGGGIATACTRSTFECTT